MTAEEKGTHDNIEAEHRGPTRRQFLTGIAAAGAGLVATTSGTAGAATLLTRRSGSGPRLWGRRSARRACDPQLFGRLFPRCLLLRPPPIRFEPR